MTDTASPAQRQAKEAGHSLTHRPALGGNDLIPAQDYVRSGRCEKPWMMVPFVAVTPLLSYGGIALGLAIGWIAGFVLVGVPGMLLDTFSGGALREISGGWSVRTLGAYFGMFCGGCVGECCALTYTTRWFIRVSQNRSLLVLAVFGSIVTAITIAPYIVFWREAVYCLSPEQQYMIVHYWVFVAGLALAAIIALVVSSEDLSAPYCEKCRSRLRPTHERRFSCEGGVVMHLAKRGDIADLLEMDAGGTQETYTTVTLLACRRQCCSYLSIVEYTIDASTGENETGGRVMAQGFLDVCRTEVWKEVLRGRCQIVGS